MTIDERLTALAQSLELLTHDIHEMQESQKRLDARESQARGALLAGVAAYLQALGDKNGEA
jgi:uncharacterized protein YllA (UPF0747 family)